MSIILKHIFRNIKEHKARSVLIFFSLLISTSMLIMSIIIPDDLTVKIEDTLRKLYGNADIAVGAYDSFKFDDLQKNDITIDYVGTRGITGKDLNDKDIIIEATDVNKAKEFKVLPEDAEDLGDNEVLVSSYVAKKKNYKKGDTIEFKYNDNTYQLTIKKIISNGGIASQTPENSMFFTNMENLKKFENIEDGYYDTILIDVKNNDEINSVADYMKDNNKDFSVEKTVDVESIKEETSMISSLLFLIFVLATTMIFFVINSLNKIILAERIPVIGTMRSVGASRKKMNLILVLENAMYGLFAGAVGSIAGIYLVGIMSNAFVVVEGVEFSKKTVEIQPHLIIIGIVFAVLLQVITTIKEILRTNKKPIKNLIFNTQNSRYKLRKRRTIISAILIIVSIIVISMKSKLGLAPLSLAMILFIVGVANLIPLIMQLISKLLYKIFKKLGLETAMLASKNIGYNKMIIASSRLVVIAISLLSTIIMMSVAVKNIFTTFNVVLEDFDLVVFNITGTSEKYDKLLEKDEFENIHYMYWYVPTEVTYDNGKQFKQTPTFYGAKGNDNVEIKELNYKIKDLKYDEMLVDQKFADKNNIKIGDTLKIKIGDINKEFEYKVVGTVDTTFINVARNHLVVSQEHFKNDITTIPDGMYISCKKGTDLEKAQETLKDEIKEVGVYVDTAKNYADMQEQSVSSVVNIFFVIIALSVLLSFVGIINNQIISFMQRRKEIAVLNSTCMNKTQLKKMLANEIIISNLIAIALSFVVAFILLLLLNEIVGIIGFYVDLKLDFITMLKFVSVVYVLLMFTLLVPFRKLKKMNIVEEIKYE